MIRRYSSTINGDGRAQHGDHAAIWKVVRKAGESFSLSSSSSTVGTECCFGSSEIRLEIRVPAMVIIVLGMLCLLPTNYCCIFYRVIWFSQPLQLLIMISFYVGSSPVVIIYTPCCCSWLLHPQKYPETAERRMYIELG